MNHDITLVTVSLGYRGKGVSRVERYVPLGVLYLTAVLEQAGFRVDFRDFQLGACKEHSDTDSSYRIFPSGGSIVEDFIAFLETSAPVLGIGCMSDLLPLTLLAVRQLKECCPDKVVILGGIGPGGVAEELMAAFPFVDIVARREGEETMVELMAGLREKGDLRSVRGIGFRYGGEVYHTSPRQWIGQVDDIPFPAYHRLDFSRYSVPGILTSRGCPFGCTFCDVSPFWGRHNRARSLGNVMAEIRLLRERYGQRYIELVDDTFTLDRERVLTFCEKLKAELPDVSWSCCGRIDCVDEEMMQAMAGSNCRLIAYGIESGSDRVLERLNKGFSISRVNEVLSLSRRYFNDVLAYFIWGFPFETMADFRETIDFISRALDAGVQPWLFSLSPLPLSEIYRQNREGLQFSPEFCSNYLGIFAGEPEIVELIKAHPRVFPGFYTCDPQFARKYAAARQMELLGIPVIHRIKPVSPSPAAQRISHE